jgi:spermidine synthase
LLGFTAVASVLPLILTDPAMAPNVLHVMACILPLSAGLGYLTPLLIDGYSHGAPEKAGRMYALNILGCVLGPLIAGYFLLPALGVKWTLLALAAPFPLLFLASLTKSVSTRLTAAWAAAIAVALIAAAFARTYEERADQPGAVLRRDHTATVVARGEGMVKQLYVNGIAMTHLTPITKVMAHLPLSCLKRKADSALVICFGMGTTYRSAAAWGLDVTAVELIPSVKQVFGYFHEDAAQLLDGARGRVVIDDGRRYLKRTQKRYDLITIDPPPPVEAAGSSLLYSEEFYLLARSHLKEGGILQQWFPEGEEKVLWAITGALRRQFAEVRAFRSLENWGYHLLASDSPIVAPSADEMLRRMPESAVRDLQEWLPGMPASETARRVLCNEVALTAISDPAGGLTVTDDRPFNEYYALRRNIALQRGTFRLAQ